MSQPRYKVIERIDAGGMAEVFKANSSSMQGFQKLVAIKRVLPSLTKKERFVRMFLDEAKVSLHLNHTNCVQVFDLGIADGTYFIVMEFVDGTNLKKIIENSVKQNTSIRLEHACFIAIEICKGLSHAHNKVDIDGVDLNIVHRDISPPNVLVSREGEVKITDFGLAKAASQAESTDPGVVKGKFGYLSPEAATGSTVDPRTDIYAVGILLWEMLAMTRLFLGRSDYDTLKLVQSGQIQSLSNFRSDIPHQLEEIIARALHKDPERRYQTCQELGRDLSTFMYSYGRPVTSYDIALLAQDALSDSPQILKKADTGVNEAIQREINKLVSLEEVDDLDMYLATNYSMASSDSDVELTGNPEDLEDPSGWADFSDDGESFFDDLGGEPSTAWQEADINQLVATASATAEIPAIQLEDDDEPTFEPTVEMSRAQIDKMYSQDVEKMTAQDVKELVDDAPTLERPGHSGQDPILRTARLPNQQLHTSNTEPPPQASASVEVSPLASVPSPAAAPASVVVTPQQPAHNPGLPTAPPKATSPQFTGTDVAIPPIVSPTQGADTDPNTQKLIIVLAIMGLLMTFLVAMVGIFVF